MTVEAWLLAATTVTAVVAVLVAVFAVRAVRRLAARLDERPDGDARAQRLEADAALPDVVDIPADVAPGITAQVRGRVVSGRVIVPPTQAQVVRTALGRPGVRLNVLLFGLRHALRAENRDRISALMRREYRHRRRERLSAGRQAVRLANPSAAPTTDRLHDRLREPQPLSLAERMTL